MPTHDDRPPPAGRVPVWALLEPGATWCTGRYAPEGGHPVDAADVFPAEHGGLCMPCIAEHDRRHPPAVRAPARPRARTAAAA